MSTDQVIIKGKSYPNTVPGRNRAAGRWAWFFLAANVFGLVALIVLLLNVLNSVFGLIEFRYAVDPATVASKPLTELNAMELATLLDEKLDRQRMRVLFRQTMISRSVQPDQINTTPVSTLLAGKQFPAELGSKTFPELTEAEIAAIMGNNLSQAQLYELADKEVLKFEIIGSWQFFASLLNRGEIEAEHAKAVEAAKAKNAPLPQLQWHSWLSWDFISRSIASTPTTAGLRTALLGSTWIILITLLVALPLGIGAAIYLEEYAKPTRLNRLIETNIRNLAGVPSIIYGMLGLAVFVRVLGDDAGITSGEVFGILDSNGRTVLSAALTMALLILPVVIINAQEAIRAVPRSIREASLGVGATKWQTTSQQVLPAAMPGILTGLILALSRAVGETAPLIVVGASTFIGVDPNGPFSKFTVVPIQIFQWTARPEVEFRNVAAAAIVVLLILLLSLNATAIFLRQRISRSLAG
jgi:phosphate transport system permease protein